MRAIAYLLPQGKPSLHSHFYATLSQHDVSWGVIPCYSVSVRHCIRHKDNRVELCRERRPKPCSTTMTSRAPQAALQRRHLLRPAALLAEHRDLQRIENGDPPTLHAIDPQGIAMPRIVGDAVETLGAHGFRRTDQTRAAQAVMIHAIAASIDGLRTIMGTSDSMASYVPHLFQVGKC